MKVIKRRAFLTTLALAAGAKAAEIRPAGGRINRARINYEGTFDTDAQTYFTAVTANGGTQSAATKAAVNAFVVSAKANGYWDKLTRINLFCGDNLAACLVPLKVGGGSATDTNNNFVAGDYSEATGLTGNGTTKYLNTGLLGTALTANDTHVAVYNRTGGSVGGGVSLGAWSSSGQLLHLLAIYTDGSCYSSQYDTGSGAVSVASTTAGFYVGSRLSATDHKLFRNGSSIASNATGGGTRPAVAFFVFARNDVGTPALFMSHAFAGYSIGYGLTAGNVTAYNTDLEVFQDALGRGVQ